MFRLKVAPLLGGFLLAMAIIWGEGKPPTVLINEPWGLALTLSYVSGLLLIIWGAWAHAER